MLSAVQAIAGNPDDRMDTMMTIREVWAAAPDTPKMPIDVFGTAPRPLMAHMPFHAEIADRAQREDRLEVAIEGLDPALGDDELRAVLASYPTLRSAGLASEIADAESYAGYYLRDFAQPVWNPRRPAGLQLPHVIGRDWTQHAPILSFSLKPSADHSTMRASAAFDAIGTVTDDATVRLIEPALGGSDSVSFHTAWWVLLLGLSQLVRYEPAMWTAAINPDSSQLAVPLEQVCDHAEWLIPNVIAEGLRQASTS